jgi:small subunit ribosomal protein S13
MARVAGIDLPNEKRIEIGLTYIKGIGKSTSQKILEATNVSPDTRVKDLTEEDVAQIQKVLTEKNMIVEGELRRIVNQNIRRLVEIKSYRGERHKSGLPVRGQRTSHNARTRKGKKKTVGGLKKKLAKK